MQIKQISQYKNILGEGTWWNNKKNLLHWTDIVQGKLYTYNPKTKHETFKKFNGKLGCFAPCKNGSFLVGLDLSFFIYDPNSGRMTKIRYSIDLMQLGIVIWGLIAVDFRNLQLSK